MPDGYTHDNLTVVYVTENVPGPTENTEEYNMIIDSFNSQLTNHCKCSQICLKISCECLYKANGTSNSPTVTQVWKEVDYPITECNKLCLCPENCGNRVVQKGPLEGLIVKKCALSEKGDGLFTNYFIPKGTFVCEYAGEVITKAEADRRHNINHSEGNMNYIYCLNEYSNSKIIKTIIDPSYIGNIGRYINHSCDPNCVVIPVRIDCPIPKLAVFSCKDILPNGELSFSYGSNPMCNETGTDFQNMVKCLCGSENCGGILPCDLNY